MKIGFDARLYDSKATGIGIYVKNLTDSLFEIDKKNEYIIFFSNKDDWQNFSEKRNIKKRLNNNPVYSLQEQSSFLYSLLKENLDLVHFPNFNFPILYPKRFVCTIHDTTSFFYPGQKRKSSKIHQLAFNLVFKTALKRAEKIITVSNFSRDDLIKHFSFLNPEKIKVTYEGVDKDFRLIENKNSLEEIKKKYKIIKPFILYVGAWRKHKNLERLALAFNLLKEKYQLDYQLVITGQEDPSFPEIKKNILSIRAKNDLVLPGFVSKKEEILLYNAADLFVLPSLTEGFGLIGLEAMACHTPIVSSKTTCLPEIYQQAVEYFDPLNIEEIAEKIAKVLKNKDLQERLIRNGLERIKEFSWQKCARETLRIYEETIS